MNQIPRSITENQIREAQAKCIEYFTKRGYGPTCSVKPYVNNNKIGFIIHRGTPRGGQTKIDQKEKRVVRFDREEKTNIVFFDRETQMLWVSATPKDVSFLAGLASEVLFGTIRFDAAVTFDLGFALAENLRERLRDAGAGDVKRVRLHSRTIKIPKGRLHQPPMSRGSCLSETDTVDAETRATGTVLNAKIAIEPKSEKRVAAGVIEIKDNMLVLPQNFNERVLRKVLRDLGILVPHAN